MIDGADHCWDWSSVKQRRARKQHRCSECCREIAPGEHYEDGRAGYDGIVDTWKTCAHCSAAVTWLQETCRGYLIHGALEDLEGHWDFEVEMRSMYLGRAIVGMRRQWRNRRGELMPVPEKWQPARAA